MFFYLRKDLKKHIKIYFLIVLLFSTTCFSLFFSRFLLNGFEKTLERAGKEGGGDLVLIPKEGDFFENLEEIEKKLEENEKIRDFEKRVRLGVSFDFQNKKYSGPIIGISEKTLIPYKEKVVLGEFLEREGEIILGKDVAKFYEKEDLKRLLGKEIKIRVLNREKIFKIKGIYEFLNPPLDLGVISFKKDLEFLDLPQVFNEILLILDSKVKIESFKGEIEKEIFQVQGGTPFERFAFLEKALKAFSIISGIIFLISLIFLILFSFIFTYLNFERKKKYLGILKTLGVSRNSLVCFFVFETLILGIFSLNFALGIYFLVEKILSSSPIIVPIGKLIPIFNFKEFAFSSFVFLFALTIPSFFLTFFLEKGVLRKVILER